MATSPTDPAGAYSLPTVRLSLWPHVLCPCGYEHHNTSQCPCGADCPACL